MTVYAARSGAGFHNTHAMNIIEIKGVRYQVRVENEVQEILYDGTWISRSDFVDALCSDNKWDQVCELALLGFNTKKLETVENENDHRRW